MKRCLKNGGDELRGGALSLIGGLDRPGMEPEEGQWQEGNRQILKARFVEWICARSDPAVGRKIIRALVRNGVRRDALLGWALAAGADRKSAARILSEVFCALGMRQRAPGAGRPASAAALFLLAFARESFGERARPVLYAAYRAAGKEDGPNGREAPLIPRAELAAAQRFLQRGDCVQPNQTDPSKILNL